MPVPQIPGRQVEPRRAYELTGRVAELCHMEGKRYLPVALSSRNATQHALLRGDTPSQAASKLRSTRLNALRLTFHCQVPR